MSVIGESLTHMDLYTNNILELASTIPVTTRLMNPDVTVTKRTAICGSSITMDLNILGQRHADVRNGLSAPPKFTLKHILITAKKRLGIFQ